MGEMGALACDEMRSLLLSRGRMNLHCTAEANCTTDGLPIARYTLAIAYCLLPIIAQVHSPVMKCVLCCSREDR